MLYRNDAKGATVREGYFMKGIEKTGKPIFAHVNVMSPESS